MEKKKFTMTPREKKLLVALLFVVVAVLIYYFVWIPQEEAKLALSERETEYQSKIDANNAVLGRESTINKEYEELKREERQISSKYIKELNQPQLIYKMNELLTKENIAFPQYSFTQPNTETIGEFEVNNMTVSMPFEGTYAGMLETMNALNSNPQKLLIERVSINGNESSEGVVSGNMNLKVYSLDGILANANGEGITPVASNTNTDSDTDIVDGNVDETTGEMATSTNTTNAVNAASMPTVDQPKSTIGKIPFVPFQSYQDKKAVEEAATEEAGEGAEEIKPFIETTIMGFDSGNYYFLPSHDFVKGNVVFSNRSKSGKSLRLEYDITAIEETNRAYIDASKNGVELNFPPDSIGIWVYSYDYQPITLGVEFKGQLGEKEEVAFTEGLGWTGWKYLTLSPPYEVAYYPCSIERFYVDMPRGRDGKGVLLLDNLETLYTRNMSEEGEDLSIQPYISYVVEIGDTFNSISFKNYGSERYANEIMNLNEMRSNDQLQPGRVIILKRR